jgi:hypothetical protein
MTHPNDALPHCRRGAVFTQWRYLWIFAAMVLENLIELPSVAIRVLIVQVISAFTSFLIRSWGLSRLLAPMPAHYC